jgi:hypothetical protein
MKINFLLTGEGSSDLRLVEHIENILIEHGFSEVKGEAPNLSLFPQRIGTSLREKLPALVKHYPSADLIFIHRDADNVGIEVRQQEINEAASETIKGKYIIPVIPVCMLESWLLADHEAIKRVAGKPSKKGPLTSIPPLRNIESTRNAKSILMDALCEASETQGNRLLNFKKRFPEMRARLTIDLDPQGPVQNLSSYKNFIKSIEDFANDQKKNKGK